METEGGKDNLMLTLWRRHLNKCPHRTKGRDYTKCPCPIWCDGELNGQRHRQSLKTRDWQRAIRLVERFERPNAERSDLVPCEQQGCNIRVEHGRCEKHKRDVPSAVEAYLKEKADISHGTLRNYRRALKFLDEHLSANNVENVHEVSRETIANFRCSREISARTWSKELEIRPWIPPVLRRAGVDEQKPRCSEDISAQEPAGH